MIKIIATLFFISFFPIKYAFASSTALSLAPHTFEISGVPGERIEKTVKIRNNGEFPIPLRFRVSEFDAEDESGNMILPEESEGEEDDFSSWISLEKKDLVIDPEKTEKLGFSVDIPGGAPDGGYYGIILLETDVSSLYVNETKTQILPSAGVLIMLSIGEEEEGDQLEILDYQISPDSRIFAVEKSLNFLSGPFSDKENEIAVVADSQPDAWAIFKNNGKRHIKIDNQIKILGLSENEKDKIDLPNITILPGKTRKVVWQREAVRNEQLKENERDEKKGIMDGLMIGPAKARLIAKEEQNGEIWEKDRIIFVFPWKAISAFLGVFFTAAYFFRKRKKKFFLWITFCQNWFTDGWKNVRIKSGKMAESFLIRKINSKINKIKNYGKKKKTER